MSTPVLDVGEEAIEKRYGCFSYAHVSDSGDDDMRDLSVVGRKRLRRKSPLGPDFAVVASMLEPGTRQVLERRIGRDASDCGIDAFGQASLEFACRSALRLIADSDRSDAPVDVPYLDTCEPAPVGLSL